MGRLEGGSFSELGKTPPYVPVETPNIDILGFGPVELPPEPIVRDLDFYGVGEVTESTRESPVPGPDLDFPPEFAPADGETPTSWRPVEIPSLGEAAKSLMTSVAVEGAIRAGEFLADAFVPGTGQFIEAVRTVVHWAELAEGVVDGDGFRISEVTRIDGLDFSAGVVIGGPPDGPVATVEVSANPFEVDARPESFVEIDEGPPPRDDKSQLQDLSSLGAEAERREQDFVAFEAEWTSQDRRAVAVAESSQQTPALALGMSVPSEMFAGPVRAAGLINHAEQTGLIERDGPDDVWHLSKKVGPLTLPDHSRLDKIDHVAFVATEIQCALIVDVATEREPSITHIGRWQRQSSPVLRWKRAMRETGWPPRGVKSSAEPRPVLSATQLGDLQGAYG